MSDETTEIDTANDHLVGTQGGRVVVLFPPTAPMDIDEALRMAAWIVTCAEISGDAGGRFEAILQAVQNS